MDQGQGWGSGLPTRLITLGSLATDSALGAHTAPGWLGPIPQFLLAKVSLRLEDVRDKYMFMFILKNLQPFIPNTFFSFPNTRFC